MKYLIENSAEAEMFMQEAITATEKELDNQLVSNVVNQMEMETDMDDWYRSKPVEEIAKATILHRIHDKYRYRTQMNAYNAIIALVNRIYKELTEQPKTYEIVLTQQLGSGNRLVIIGRRDYCSLQIDNNNGRNHNKTWLEDYIDIQPNHTWILWELAPSNFPKMPEDTSSPKIATEYHCSPTMPVNNSLIAEHNQITDNHFINGQLIVINGGEKKDIHGDKKEDINGDGEGA